MRFFFLSVLALGTVASAAPNVRAQTETVPLPQTLGETPTPAASPDAPPVVLPDNPPEKRRGFWDALGLPKRGEHLRPGGIYSTYLPASGTVRNLFGNQWSGFGFEFGRLSVPKTNGKLSFENAILTSSRNGNRATLVPVGALYTTGFGDSRTRGTLGVGTGLLLLDSRVRSENKPSRWRGGANASVFAGVALGSSGSLRAGYRWAERVRGFDLSGTSLEASFRF